MSSLWTPSGERPVPPPGASTSRGEPPGSAPGTGPPGQGSPERERGPGAPTEEELQARMTELRRQLADAPVEAVVANHAYGLFELGALHLSLDPPRLEKARVAIDALASLVEGMAGRLGDQEASLRDGLAQIRLAFVQITAGRQGDGAVRAEQSGHTGGGGEDPR